MARRDERGEDSRGPCAAGGIADSPLPPECASTLSDTHSTQNDSSRSGVTLTRTDPVSSRTSTESPDPEASRLANAAFPNKPRTRSLAQDPLREVMTAWRAATDMNASKLRAEHDESVTA